MPLSKSERTERIVSAAAHLFASQGFHGTTTREIAQLAEVSENTLFRHFDDKEEIFCSAVRSHVTALRPQWELLKELKAGESLRVALPKILEQLAEAANRKPEIVRLIAVALVELQGKAETVCRDLISPLFFEISQYLAITVERGEVVEVDPSLLAASLMSMVLIQPQLSRLMGVNQCTGSDSMGAVDVYSKFWFGVLSPKLSVQSGSSLIAGE